MNIPLNCLLPQAFRNCIWKASGSKKTDTNIAYAFMRTFKKYTYIYKSIYTYIYTHTHTHTHTHTCMHACTHAYIYIYIYTHIHTHTQIQYCLIWYSYTYTVQLWTADWKLLRTYSKQIPLPRVQTAQILMVLQVAWNWTSLISFWVTRW
jgi:hypothetical protein